MGRPGASLDDRIFVINIYLPNGDSFEPLATINGKTWPYTERITSQAGESMQWRWINTSNSDHAMHLHGFYFQMNGTGDQDHFVHYKPNEQEMMVSPVGPARLRKPLLPLPRVRVSSCT